MCMHACMHVCAFSGMCSLHLCSYMCVRAHAVCGVVGNKGLGKEEFDLCHSFSMLW